MTRAIKIDLNDPLRYFSENPTPQSESADRILVATVAAIAVVAVVGFVFVAARFL